MMQVPEVVGLEEDLLMEHLLEVLVVEVVVGLGEVEVKVLEEHLVLLCHLLQEQMGVCQSLVALS